MMSSSLLDLTYSAVQEQARQSDRPGVYSSNRVPHLKARQRTVANRRIRFRSGARVDPATTDSADLGDNDEAVNSQESSSSLQCRLEHRRSTECVKCSSI